MNGNDNMLEPCLDVIATRHGADKASSHPVKGHGYTRHYEQFFKLWRYDKINLLEIGVGGGESIQTWLEYFPNARIYGVDIVQGTNPWNTAGSGADPRYIFAHGDQSSVEFWNSFLKQWPLELHIVIDDGGHFNNQVLTTWAALWPHMAPGGHYCVEDIGCAYTPGTVFLIPGWPTHQEFFKELFDDVHTGDIRQMSVTRELVILEKI